MKEQLSIAPASPFDFKATAYSHGWVMLAPNTWKDGQAAVHRVERLRSGKVVLLQITDAGADAHPELAIEVTHTRGLSAAEGKEIVATVARMFRADEDFGPFYALCREKGGLWTRLTAGLGRLLRSPTLFEDVVKTICTTNIQWGGTVRMVAELVKAFGEPYAGDAAQRAFPIPEAIAAESLDAFNASVRLGYRGAYVHTLAQRVASGELDLEALRDSSIPTPELKKELLAIKGVGPYAAATLLMLLGRYDELAIDTEFRAFVGKKYFDGSYPSDKEAQATYADWGQWKYLAYWFDVWQDYYQAA